MDFTKIFKKRKAEPINTALQRERMQPKTIEKLETIGKTLKNDHPRFLGNGHIIVLGPVVCFIPLSIFMLLAYGPLTLLFWIIPAILAPLFIYLRAKGTEELYGRSDFDLGLFHYKSCKSYVGHGRYIYETVIKATIPYIAFALIMGTVFLVWGADFSDVNYRNLYSVSGQLDYVSDEGDYIAFGIVSNYGSYDPENGDTLDDTVKRVEYRLEKYPERLDRSFFEDVKPGDTVRFLSSRISTSGKSTKDGKQADIYSIYLVEANGVEYFGEKDVEAGKSVETTNLIIAISVFAVYVAVCGVAIYFAKQYAERNAEYETINLPELV